MTVLLAFLIPFVAVLLVVGLRFANPCPQRQQQDNDPKCMAAYPAQPIKGRERYRVMMDIRRLDEQNWLTVDGKYPDEHKVRTQLLEEKKGQVLQCLPESYEACLEALEEVVEFLCHRYPNMFKKESNGKTKTVHNKMTGEIFAYGGDDGSAQLDPLEIAVRLTMEDLSILMKNDDEEYYLAASASLFPVGWTVQQRIGWTITQLHGPVPLWQQQVGNSVCKFFCRLTPSSPMERSNYFVEVKRPNENLLDTLYRPTSLFEVDGEPTPQNIMIRRERQTFRRLPRTGTILFGVRTFLTPLDELPLQELQNLAKEVKSWPHFVGEYKGKDIWGRKMLEFCEKRTREEAEVREKTLV
ncbi:hypothetical protein MPDQ_003346 [Monascus purpureus]|uniref:Uncharacterized protein n=1 Tax=Monascus purpureus TaxID=5098 RepID=A0A507QLL6_MONPU|nr:hypothetical protein MPDQ_003346 [Monascus purpureus]BDD57242.1 hypothetical protein MAP00_002627 [Monascus purpureus]